MLIDARHPAVTRLDPSLRAAVRSAARDAKRAGVEIRVNSGWRSAQYQEKLLEDAVSRYGSRKEAARWVATAKTSSQVTDKAVDLGPMPAQALVGRERFDLWVVSHLSQRAVALRAATGRDRPWVPAHVRGPDQGSEDAGLTALRDFRIFDPSGQYLRITEDTRTWVRGSVLGRRGWASHPRFGICAIDV